MLTCLNSMGLCTLETPFQCGGTGKRKKPAVVKIYTPEYEAFLTEKAAERFRKRQVEANKKFLHSNGFSDDGTGYVFTGNTFNYKDVLKEGGARWNNYTHWIAPNPIGEYPYIKVSANELCDLESDMYHLDYNKCMNWVDHNKPW